MELTIVLHLNQSINSKKCVHDFKYPKVYSSLLLTHENSNIQIDTERERRERGSNGHNL